jgi:signal transduction histidine kinase
MYEIWSAPVFDDGVPGPRVLNTVLLLLATLPLAVRRRTPTLVFGLVVSAVVVQATWVDAPRSDQPPVQCWVALLVACFSLGAHAEQRRAVVAATAAGVVFLGQQLGLHAAGYGTKVEDMVMSLFILAASFGLGLALRGQQVKSALLASRAERLEREREQRARLAVAEERVRIGRELHDVVAHAVSVMVVQAQAANRVLDGENRSAREALDAIETTGRQALAEMRRLLGAVRAQNEEPDLSPRPTLAGLDQLAAEVREAGLPVHVRIEGEATALPPGVDLSAYRIVQEALTNTLKHAGPATAEVIIRYDPEGVEVEVTDDGAGDHGRPITRGSGGHGLIGMRERAQLVGGSVNIGPRQGHGYVVRARLPM